ncbi:hypothetical protein HOY80DRAFT_897640, partial [Tuber brumale]
IKIPKEPSPAVKPATQYGSLINIDSTLDLSTGVISGKAAFSNTDKPKFIDALIDTILTIPGRVKCSF